MAGLGAQIKVLQSKQAQIMAHMTSILDFAKKIKQADKSILDTFRLKINSLDILRDSYIEVTERLNMVMAEADEDYEPSFQTIDTMLEIHGTIAASFHKLELLVCPPPKQNPPSTSTTQLDQQSSSPAKIKLPTLELKAFSGEPSDWVVFYDLFKSMIHDRTDLSNAQKCQYLLSRLSGRALACCSSIPATPENYEIILQILVDKYNDKRVLCHHYLDALFNFKPLKLENISSMNSFIDNFGAAVAALKALQMDSLEDCILLYLAQSKLCPETIKLFERTLKKDEVPMFESLMEFMKTQSKILARVHTASTPSQTATPTTSKLLVQSKKPVTHSFLLESTSPLGKAPVARQKDCFLCKKGPHLLFRCDKFHSLSPRDRYNIARSNYLCLNCLSATHGIKDCNSKSTCSKCNKKHHTLLHFPVIEFTPPSSGENSPQEAVKSGKTVTMCSMLGAENKISKEQTVLLSTVRVNVYDAAGNKHEARFLLDGGSQSHFITAKLCDELQLPRKDSSTVVSGLGLGSSPVLGESSLTIESIVDTSCSYELKALVVKEITGKLPSVQVCMDALSHLDNVKLADKSFGSPGEIHGLIGAALYPYLMLPGQVKSSASGPVALNTTLGYVVVGSASICSSPSNSSYCGFISTNLETLVQRFWENEEIAPPDGPVLTKEEEEAEDHFNQHCYFDKEKSRYCVSLPFKRHPSELGGSFDIARNRFLALEKKFGKNQDLRKNYIKAISELSDSSQLELCQNDNREGYYVPHHMVVKEQSLSTKYRIVFDFSCPTTTGISLNDIVYSGPKLYTHCFDILTNFRLYKIALVADIAKMFLQILVSEEDHQYQKILWRSSPGSPLQTYQMNRVTFGLRSSPFLAQRVIRRLADDKREEFPLVKQIVDSSFYMDDLTTSVPTIEKALELQNQLISCFKSASFDLVKWSSNSQQLMDSTPEHHALASLSAGHAEDSLRVLGMTWSSKEDWFSFSVAVEDKICTKRTVLSNLARIWDPLGLVGPVTVCCKIILQSLWTLQLNWDSPAPIEIADTWKRVLSELNLLTNIRVPRHIEVFTNSQLMLVGFCDASERACAAVVYSRTVSEDGQIKISLLCSKSKVAPLKKISIPRLELNAALLLARLVQSVYGNYNERQPVDQVLCCSDSTVALHWINASPHKWQTYVANRVTKIQELVPPGSWYHVSGKENSSADCLSRGLTPFQLVDHQTWLHGPAFLQLEPADWPIVKLESSSGIMPEEKTVTLVTTNPQESFLLELAERFSSWKRLTNTLVYVFRFLKKLPSKKSIEVSDIEYVEQTLWIAVQKRHSKNLRDQKKLSPFVDEEGVIRVGGRLNNADVPYYQKHPVLLPKNEHVVRLLVRHIHETNLHTGPSLLMAILRQNYWILAARSLVRRLVQNCNRCFRSQPVSTQPVMADLPKYRVQEVKPFANTGVDFAGPFTITLSKHRGVRSQKAYLCLFICLATKALHLELVSDLSTEAFVNTLKRFLARRGPVGTMYSDNGTNFIGTKNMLDALYKHLVSKEFMGAYGEELLRHRIQWKTLPPASPHMAGIWERQNRSVKSHLYKVIGNQILTFEELSTVLAQIESLLNSRPICVLSSDPNDPEPLTPAHFIKLTPLHHLPAVKIDEERLNRLTRFQLLDQMVQSFWKRWHLEYLNSLQEKSKWTSAGASNITVGTVVLIKDDNAAPLQWLLGTVLEVYPSHSDGVVRVAKVKTKTGIFKRPVVKLCPLPTQ